MSITTKPKFPILDSKNGLARARMILPFCEGSGTIIRDVVNGIVGNSDNTTYPLNPNLGWRERALYQGITAPSFNFDGVMDDFRFLDSASIPQVGDFSFVAWVNPSTLLNGSSTTDKIVLNAGDANSFNDFGLVFQGSTNKELSLTAGCFYFRMNTSSATAKSFATAKTTAVSWAANTWVCFIGTYSASNARMRLFYKVVDGTAWSTVVPEAVTTATRGVGAPTTTQLMIGAHYDNTTYPGRYFPGQIDLVSIFDYEFQEDQIQSMFTDPFQIFDTGSDSGEIFDVDAASDFNLCKNDILHCALRKVGRDDDNQTAANMHQADVALNLYIKSLETDGTRVWTYEWATHPLMAPDFVVGRRDTNNYRCIREHQATNDTEPGVGPNWMSYWYIDTNLTAGTVTNMTVAAAPWNPGQNYKSAGNFSLPKDVIGIDSPFIRRQNLDITMEMISMSNYMERIPNKFQTSALPIYIVFHQRINQPEVFLWPQPNIPSLILHYKKYRALHDMQEAGSLPDFWNRWTLALIYGTAWQLSDEFGLGLEKKQWLKGVADEYLQKAKKGDREYARDRFVKGCYTYQR